MYLKAPGPVVITVTDKAGKLIRTLRQRGEVGVNRFVWNLRHDMPGAGTGAPGPGGRGAAGGEGEAPAGPSTGSGQGGRGGAQGIAVLPGEYTVTVNAGGQTLTGSATVQLDPGVTASAADLEAQLQASLAATALQVRVNTLVDRVDSLIAQLTAIDGQLPRQNPPAYAAPVKQALEKLKTFRDDELVRPLAGLGYRQYPRLREDVQSLVGYFGRGFRAPNDGEVLRMKDLTAQVEKDITAVNGIIAKEIAAINEAMRSAPRIAAEPIR